MSADWVKLAKADGVTISDDVANVSLGERAHRVSVVDEDGAYRLVAIVAHPAAVERMTDPVLAAWQRNRSSRLVGFRVDHRGRLLGEAWVPKDGLTAQEFQICLRAVAAESDRVEMLATGRDVE